MAKPKNITLKHNLLDEHYTVVKLTNSVDYRPGQVLKKTEAKDLCDSPRWNVTVEG